MSTLTGVSPHLSRLDPDRVKIFNTRLLSCSASSSRCDVSAPGHAPCARELISGQVDARRALCSVITLRLRHWSGIRFYLHFQALHSGSLTISKSTLTVPSYMTKKHGNYSTFSLMTYKKTQMNTVVRSFATSDVPLQSHTLTSSLRLTSGLTSSILFNTGGFQSLTCQDPKI